MADVVGFRPSDEERAMIERAKAAHGFRTNAEALRFLIRKGAQAEVGKRPETLLAYRVPKRFRDARTTTSKEIDEAVYGGPR